MVANICGALETEGISAYRFDFSGNGYVMIYNLVKCILLEKDFLFIYKYVTLKFLLHHVREKCDLENFYVLI